MIRLNDLTRQHEEIKEDLIKQFSLTLENSSFIQGSSVVNFEKEFSNINDTSYCTSCANGTDAIYISLKALNIQKGDEVIVPSITWISTASTVVQAGGTPIFCDVEEDTLLIDCLSIKRLITRKTKGIIAVHLYGQAADMDHLTSISKEYGLWIIEDCAQAHLASFNGKKVGNFGELGTFSFYPGKNLGALGDGGAIVTNNKNIYDFAWKYARHGSVKKGEFEFLGINSRLDTLQASILRVKLNRLESYIKKREIVATKYIDGIKNTGLKVLHRKKNRRHTYHQFVVKTKNRTYLRDKLFQSGIETGIHYPFSLNNLEIFNSVSSKKYVCKNAEIASKQVLSLPIFPSMTNQEIDYVISTINKIDL